MQNKKQEVIIMNCGLGKLALFVGGVLFGTAGIKILSGREAKKAYTHVAAAALRAKDDIMTTVTAVRENVDDILADAKELNEKIAADEEAEVVNDCEEAPECDTEVE